MVENRSTHLIPMLIKKSNARLEKNKEFQVFLKKRARLKKRFDTKTISLSLKHRIAEAKAEKELDEIQNGSFLTNIDSEQKKDKEDWVLNETLQILSDMINAKNDHSTEIVIPVVSTTK